MDHVDRYIDIENDLFNMGASLQNVATGASEPVFLAATIEILKNLDMLGGQEDKDAVIAGIIEYCTVRGIGKGKIASLETLIEFYRNLETVSEASAEQIRGEAAEEERETISGRVDL